MPRARKQHVQQPLFKSRGGKRRRAGRPQVNERKSEPHRVRPPITVRDVIHVSLRVQPGIARLRGFETYAALRRAAAVVSARADVRLVHISIQANHVHVLAEADHKYALAAGMKAFQISAAKRLNACRSASNTSKPRRGTVFPDRYHAEVIKSPTQMRHALSYVLNNWRRHREDRASYARTWVIDPYSTAAAFTGWSEGQLAAPAHFVDEIGRLPVASPQTWLMREGWKRAGGISAFEAPGPEPGPRRGQPDARR